MLNKKLIFFVAISSYIYVKYSNMPIPKGIEEPHIYKRYRIILNGIFMISFFGEKLNYGPALVIFRNLMNYLKVKNNHPAVQQVDTKINEVSVRIYKPISLKDSKNAPILIYYHGGAYFFGDSDYYNGFLNKLTKELNIVAISVNYRLAPEHPYPAPTDDCFAVTKYVLESSDEFGDTNKVILAGDSAGGNAVAIITQKILQQKLKMPKLQVLIYPWVQMVNFKLPSLIKYKQGKTVAKMIVEYLGYSNMSKETLQFLSDNNHFHLIDDSKLKEKYLSRSSPNLIPKKFKAEQSYYDSYDKEFLSKKVENLSRFREDKKLAYIIEKMFSDETSPGLADKEKLIGLPNAYFIITEFDGIRDEGFIYSEHLKDAGVNVEVKYYENGFHGCINNKLHKVTQDITADLLKYINDNI